MYDLIVVKAANRPNVFGAYNAEAWTQAGNYGTNQSSYLFSLINSHGKPIRLEPVGTYVFSSPPLSSCISILCCIGAHRNMSYNAASYGPTFGSGHDFHLNNNMKSNSNYCRNNDFTRLATGFDAYVTHLLLSFSDLL
jgi:hypothetical protein